MPPKKTNLETLIAAVPTLSKCGVSCIMVGDITIRFQEPSSVSKTVDRLLNHANDPNGGYYSQAVVDELRPGSQEWKKRLGDLERELEIIAANPEFFDLLRDKYGHGKVCSICGMYNDQGIHGSPWCCICQVELDKLSPTLSDTVPKSTEDLTSINETDRDIRELAEAEIDHDPPAEKNAGESGNLDLDHTD